MKISVEALGEIKDALVNYKGTVDDTSMTESSKKTYTLHAEHFVRWLDDDFEPGGRKF